MTFASQAFLFALAAAAGPVIIHLLNRQRYRTVDWAPMEFLLRAVRRRRRRVQLRDLLLLLLRTLAIVFFVLSMARPIWTTQGSDVAGQPIHAILVFDNSLSMAYTPFDQSRLEIARNKARQFIRDLPAGSDVTVIPMCQQGDAWFSDVYDSKEDALDAVARIDIVDRTARIDGLGDRIVRARSQSGTSPTKRVIVFSDMQEATWARFSDDVDINGLGEVKYVTFGSDDGSDENTWVESLSLRGGFAESGVTAVFDAVIQHQGRGPRRQVRAVLTVDGQVVGERFVDVEPGGKKEIAFEYTFEALGGVVNPAFVPAEIQLESDRLALDDRRYYVAPVFKRAPILFVDQHGELEDPQQNRFGESWPLRVLYASRLGAARGLYNRPANLRAVTIDAITREILKDVRLVVIAGVSSPNVDQVKMLRHFVEQGGQLMITAGAEFNAEQWNTVAWNGGAGLLPASLSTEPLGAVPKGGDWQAAERFHLDASSLRRDLFDLQLSGEDWDALVGSSFFYQAIQVNSQSLDGDNDSATTPVSLAASRARVVGQFDNGAVFAMHGTIGDGNVILVSTSCFPSWNNLALQPGILLYERMTHWLIHQSIAERNYVERSELTLAVDRRDQQRQFQLVSTSTAQAVSLGVEAVGDDEFAVIARGIDARDILEIRRQADEGGAQDGASIETFRFAVNGPSEESRLTSVEKDSLAGETHWLRADEEITLTDGGSIQRDLWLYLLALAALCLLAEMVVASGSFSRRAPSAEVAG